MSRNRLLTLLAFVVYCGFLGILVAWVPRLDLGLVVAATVLFTIYDLFIHRPPHGSR